LSGYCFPSACVLSPKIAADFPFACLKTPLLGAKNPQNGLLTK
jgi:hypothetical protein